MKLTKKIFLYASLLFFQINQNVFCMEFFDKDDSVKKGTIFMLVGTSCSGKTTILNRIKQVQEKDTKPYTELAIFEPDKIKNSSIEKYTEARSLEEDIERLSPFSSPKFAHSKFSKSSEDFENFSDFETNNLEPEHNLTIDEVKKIADTGTSVVFDTILLNRKDQPDDLYKSIKEEFEGYDLCTILVYCPIDVIYTNIISKNSTAQLRKSPKDSRNAFLALKQFPLVFEPTSPTNEQVLDQISLKEVQSLCSKIAPKNDIAHCFLLNLFNKKFGLSEENSTVFIKPKNKYDFIFRNNQTTNQAIKTLNIDQLLAFIKSKIETQNKTD